MEEFLYNFSELWTRNIFFHLKYRTVLIPKLPQFQPNDLQFHVSSHSNEQSVMARHALPKEYQVEVSTSMFTVILSWWLTIFKYSRLTIVVITSDGQDVQTAITLSLCRRHVSASLVASLAYIVVFDIVFICSFVLWKHPCFTTTSIKQGCCHGTMCSSRHRNDIVSSAPSEPD